MDDDADPIIRLREAWQAAEDAYTAERDRYFVIVDALGDGQLPNPEKVFTPAAADKLKAFREAAAGAQDAWHAEMRFRIDEDAEDVASIEHREHNTIPLAELHETLDDD